MDKLIVQMALMNYIALEMVRWVKNDFLLYA